MEDTDVTLLCRDSADAPIESLSVNRDLLMRGSHFFKHALEDMDDTTILDLTAAPPAGRALSPARVTASTLRWWLSFVDPRYKQCVCKAIDLDALRTLKALATTAYVLDKLNTADPDVQLFDLIKDDYQEEEAYHMPFLASHKLTASLCVLSSEPWSGAVRTLDEEEGVEGRMPVWRLEFGLGRHLGTFPDQAHSLYWMVHHIVLCMWGVCGELGLASAAARIAGFMLQHDALFNTPDFAQLLFAASPHHTRELVEAVFRHCSAKHEASSDVQKLVPLPRGGAPPTLTPAFFEGPRGDWYAFDLPGCTWCASVSSSGAVRLH